MTFLNPAMLVGLAAALVPLALHLLNRARYRNVEWAAMMFLGGVDARSHHSARLKQWLLLGARGGTVALLAVALARPVFYGRGAPPPPRAGRSAAVILLDRSASMSLSDNGRPRLDLAREAVFQLLSPGFRRGDDLWVISMGEPDPTAPPLYAADPQDMARQLQDLPVSSGVADVAGALDRALELLGGTSAANREVYVVCDRQADSWRGVDDAFAARWRARVAALPPDRRPRLVVVPVGTAETDNVAIESVRPIPEPLVVGQAGEVEVRIRNYGAVPRANVAVNLRLRAPNAPAGSDGAVVGAGTMNLPPNATATRTFPVTAAEPGSHVLIASFDGAPGLQAGKQLDYAVDARRPPRVLVIDGDEREGAPQTASDFLRPALTTFRDPSRDAAAALDVTRPDVWVPSDLAGYGVVVLANVPALTDAQARALEQFVYDGGGLIVAPGDQVRAETYNAQLPWLPAALHPATSDSESRGTTVGSLQLGHPIFHFLGGRPDPAPPAAVRRYFPATPRPGAADLADLADGHPFLLTADVGRGRALVMTTPFDTDWNALPLTGLFVPLVGSATAYAAAGPAAHDAAARNVAAGAPLTAEFHEPVDARAVRLGGYGLNAGTPPPDLAVSSGAGGSSQVTWLGRAVPGFYRMGIHGNIVDPRAVHFAVRTPAEESDLTPMSSEQWRRAQDALGFDWADPDRRPLPAAQEAIRNGWDLWVPLLGAAIVLGVIELTATRRWAGRDA